MWECVACGGAASCTGNSSVENSSLGESFLGWRVCTRECLDRVSRQHASLRDIWRLHPPNPARPTTTSTGSGGRNRAPAPRRSDGAGPAPLRSALRPPSLTGRRRGPRGFSLPPSSLLLLPPPPSSLPRTEVAAAMDDSGLIRRRRLQVRCSPGSKEGMGSVPWGGAEQNTGELAPGSALATLSTARGCSGLGVQWPRVLAARTPPLRRCPCIPEATGGAAS